MQEITGEIVADVVRSVVGSADDAADLSCPPSASLSWTTPVPWWPSSG